MCVHMGLPCFSKDSPSGKAERTCSLQKHLSSVLQQGIQTQPRLTFPQSPDESQAGPLLSPCRPLPCRPLLVCTCANTRTDLDSCCMLCACVCGGVGGGQCALGSFLCPPASPIPLPLDSPCIQTPWGQSNQEMRLYSRQNGKPQRQIKSGEKYFFYVMRDTVCTFNSVTN